MISEKFRQDFEEATQAREQEVREVTENANQKLSQVINQYETLIDQFKRQMGE